MWVEAESNRIGDLQLPTELWRAMKAAGGVELRLPTVERTRHLLREYTHFTERPDHLKELLRRLKYKLGGDAVAAWCADIDAGRWERFVGNVLEQHYDPAYRHSRERDFPNVAERLDLPDTGEAAVRAAAERLIDLSANPDREGGGVSDPTSSLAVTY